MKSVRFIHGADIHLDSPMTGLRSLPANIFGRLQESTFTAFRRLIDSAILHKVDFVILAGDLFDSEDRSIKAQIFLRKELERLEKEGIPAFIIHGNHDHLEGHLDGIHYPSNVHIFGPSVTTRRFQTRNGTVVHLYGFSYRERHVYERKIEEYPFQSGADFHIGILHGNIDGGGDHGNYAPFQIRDLLDRNYHYWALGHIHKRIVLHEEPPIVYPGNTQGRNRKEKGEKGCYLVHMHESHCELDFIETGDVVWSDLEIDAGTCSTIDTLYQTITEELESVRREDKGVLVHLTVHNLRKKEFQLRKVDELLEIFQEGEKDSSAFVWPVYIDTVEKPTWKREELLGESDFYGELFRTMDKFSHADGALSPLYRHHHARKHLSELSDIDMKEIRGAAEMFLLERLIKDR